MVEQFAEGIECRILPRQDEEQELPNQRVFPGRRRVVTGHEFRRSGHVSQNVRARKQVGQMGKGRPGCG